MRSYWFEQALSVLASESDNLVYVLLAVGLMFAAGYMEMNQAGLKIADMLLGALLIKIKS